MKQQFSPQKEGGHVSSAMPGGKVILAAVAILLLAVVIFGSGCADTSSSGSGNAEEPAGDGGSSGTIAPADSTGIIETADITEILEPTPAADGIVGQRYESEVPSIFEDPATHSIFITDVSVKNEMVKLTIKNYHKKLSYDCRAVGVNPLEREVFLAAGRNFILGPGEEVTLREKIVSQPELEIQYNTVAGVTLRGGLFLPR